MCKPKCRSDSHASNTTFRIPQYTYSRKARLKNTPIYLSRMSWVRSASWLGIACALLTRGENVTSGANRVTSTASLTASATFFVLAPLLEKLPRLLSRSRYEYLQTESFSLQTWSAACGTFDSPIDIPNSINYVYIHYGGEKKEKER